jgi:hypothetical protein
VPKEKRWRAHETDDEIVESEVAFAEALRRRFDHGLVRTIEFAVTRRKPIELRRYAAIQQF